MENNAVIPSLFITKYELVIKSIKKSIVSETKTRGAFGDAEETLDR